MRTCIVIGAKGFIGSAVAREAAGRGGDVLGGDLDNYAAAKGAEAELLVYAGGNARKYVDERDPAEGFDLSVRGLQRVATDFRYDFFLHLSSGAVYPDEGRPEANGEETELRPERMTRYGFHKWLAEQVTRHYAARRLIVRMGGFVGPGLKKNAVRDVLGGGELWVHPDSKFQFMDTRDLARIALDLAAAGTEADALNLSGEGTVSVREIAAMAGRELRAEDFEKPKVRAELNLEKARRLAALPGSAESVRRFVEEVRAGKARLG